MNQQDERHRGQNREEHGQHGGRKDEWRGMGDGTRRPQPSGAEQPLLARPGPPVDARKLGKRVGPADVPDGSAGPSEPELTARRARG